MYIVQCCLGLTVLLCFCGAVCRFLCLQNKLMAEVCFNQYTSQHPQVERGPPFVRPLLNFLWMLLLAVDGYDLISSTSCNNCWLVASITKTLQCSSINFADPLPKPCKPVYSEMVSKPRNSDCCGRKGTRLKMPWGVWRNLLSLVCVAAASQLVVIQWEMRVAGWPLVWKTWKC